MISISFLSAPSHIYALPVKESGILTGFGAGELHGQNDYMPVPIIWHIGYDFKPILRKINITPEAIVELYLEPQINPVVSPDTNVEFGCGVGFHIIFAASGKIRPYLTFGSGLIYITQSTEEQSTKYNFQDQAGAGIYYFLDEKSALNFGYRIRHISNAGIKHPNSGIDTHIGEFGYSIFF
jgi:hypothetical protein